jgi:uncharacterized membrane protein
MTSDANKGKKMPDLMKSAAAMMVADIMLLLGVVFVLMGIGRFISGYLGIDGSGEGIIGIVLLALGLVILTRSKLKVSFSPVPMAPPQPPIPEAPSDSYR